MTGTRAHRSRFVAILLAAACFGPSLALPVDVQAATAQPMLEAVTLSAAGVIQLAAHAAPAPRSYGTFRRFGLFDSIPATLSSFSRLSIKYRRQAPSGTAARLDVRARSAGAMWSEWHVGVADGEQIAWEQAMVEAQYRVVLLSNTGASPSISHVAFAEPILDADVQTTAKLAPTYRLRVTRQGMVGGRTANGHVIGKNDVFVSLPSFRSLSSRGGNEYQVRLSANGRSIVAPVMDVGPWNHHDNYWSSKREWYGDLPVGWPQDHAAYFEEHNGGKAELGHVNYPTAVDIGDGAYWHLGLDGAQSTVDVTFLWIGSDPGPNPDPLNTKPSVRPSGAPPNAAEPTAEATPEPTAEATAEPTAELQPTPEATAEATPAPQPTSEPVPDSEPTSDPASEATPESTPEPTATATAKPQPSPEPSPEPSAEPAPEASPEATAKPQPTPKPDPEPQPTAEATPESQPVPEPQPAPQPEQAATVNDGDGGFFAEGSNWSSEQLDCAFDGQAHWVAATGTTSASHQAVWRPALGGASFRSYEVQVFVPGCAADGGSIAEYIIQPVGPATTVVVDQVASAGQWVSLGRFPFAAEGGYVQLRNSGGNEGDPLWFDAVRWLPAEQ